MRYQEQMVRMTLRALDDVVRAVYALPPGFASWKAGGESRSALEQMQEIAASGAFYIPILTLETIKFDRKTMVKLKAAMEEYPTVDSAIAGARQTITEIAQAIMDFPDERLEDEVDLPMGGGTRMTMADILAMPYWNMVYHLGQINQIQLILGDRSFH